MRRLGLSLVVLSAAILPLPSGAQAQVVVDPDSPAGKEYAIPLEEKRANAGGGDGGQAEPFGEGISNPSAKGARNGTDETDGNGTKDGKGKKDEKGGDSDSLAALGTSDSGGGSGSGGGPDEAGANGALLTSGIALAVLLLGGGFAFLMRRGAFGTDA